jgi:hypothetical protein
MIQDVHPGSRILIFFHRDPGSGPGSRGKKSTGVEFATLLSSCLWSQLYRYLKMETGPLSVRQVYWFGKVFKMSFHFEMFV